MIEHDQGINKIGCDIAGLLVGQAKTAKVITDVRQNQDHKLEVHDAKVVAELKETHPILSRIGDWLSRHQNKARRQFSLENMWAGHNEAVIKYKDMGLDQSAYFLQRDMSFRKDQEPILLPELKKMCKRPTVEKTFSTRIWMPQNWVISERIGKSDRWRVVPTILVDSSKGDDTMTIASPTKTKNNSLKDPEAGNDSKMSSLSSMASYRVEKKIYFKSDSSCWFWRWKNFILRTNAFFWNCLFLLSVVIPWCSPLSFRALFYTEPFYPQHVLNKLDGTIVISRESETQTVISRLTSLWNHIREKRKEFENTPDTGLLSKSMTRHFHRFVHYVLKGLFGSLFIVIALPLLMAFVSTFSIILALLSPIYIWIGSAIVHLVGFLFYDFESRSFTTTVCWNVFINLIGIGILQPIVCAIMAFIVFPLGTGLGCFAAFARKGFRDAWDAIIYQLVIRKRARVPLGNGFLAKRISGPGMASTYYYQIKTEQALVALETFTELDRLTTYQSYTSRQITLPQNEYKEFVQKHFGPFGVDVGGGNLSPYNKLQIECKGLLESLDEKVRKRKTQLYCDLPDGMKRRIRLNEEDLKLVLLQGTVMVEEFYSKEVLPKMAETEAVNFWFTKNLSENDWLGLTSYLLSDLFCSDFLAPLQELDTTFSLQVKHWNLNRYLTMALDAKWRDDLDVTRVMQTAKLGTFISQPDIPLESFNPMATEPYGFHGSFRDHDEEQKWKLYRSKKSDVGDKLTNPLPLPHPIEISVIISNRDTLSTAAHLDIDKMSFKSLLR